MIVGLLLAAGHSTRFGSNKLLSAPSGQPPLVLQSANTLLSLQHRLAVIPAESGPLRSLFQSIRCPVVEVPETDPIGLALSLRTGLMASPMASGWIIALADMPWVRPETVQRVHEALAGGAAIVACRHQGQRGNPVGFSRRYWHDLMALQGDQGARRLLEAYADDVTWLDVDDPGILKDIDRPSDWA